jgi:hypothetical protein
MARIVTPYRFAKQYYTIKRVLIAVVMTGLLQGCKKFIEIPPSPNQIQTSDIFENDKTALSAALSVYAQMRQSTSLFTNAGMSLFSGLAADEIYNTAASTMYDPFYTNSLTSNLSAVNSNFYSHSYKSIYSINAILDGLQKSTALTDSLQKQLTGEMKTLRAFYYFYLVNLFGDVPLVLEIDYRKNAILARTDKAVVYNQIINDLKEGIALLKPAYASPGKARVNKWAATALLARSYLYLGEWLKAEAAATEVINGGYSLVTNLNNVFLINSSETIWEVAPTNDAANSAQGSSYIPSSTTVKPAFALTAQQLNAFEATDQRKTNWTKTNTVSGIVYYYPNKYKVRTNTPVTEYNVVLRLAEQYLIRAEARAQQDNLAGARADINQVRLRAGLTVITVNSRDSVLTAIEKERQAELFTEWGDRWLNLKRTNKAEAVLSAIKGTNWQSTDQLFPIPQNELLYNVYLVQNPGYN